MERPNEETIKSLLSESVNNAFQTIDMLIQSDSKSKIPHNHGDLIIADPSFYRTMDEVKYAERIISDVLMDALKKTFVLYYGEDAVNPYNKYHISFIVQFKKGNIAFGHNVSFHEDWKQIGSQIDIKVIENISFQNNYGGPPMIYPFLFGGKDGVKYETVYLENISKKYLDEWIAPLLFETINTLENEFKRRISSITIDLPSPTKTYWFKNETLERISHFNGYYTEEYMDYANYYSDEKKEERRQKEWTYITIIEDEKKLNYSVTEEYNLSNETKNILKRQFFDKGYCNILFGDSEFATSFLTSEWLFHSLRRNVSVKLGDYEKSIRNEGNLDYTAIVCGYLKSIEQLLFLLMKCRVNKGHFVKAKDETPDVICRIEYKKNREGKNIPIKYIPLTKDTLKYVKTELWYSEFFIKNKAGADAVLNVDDSDLEIIYSAIDDFRKKCRNGNFHVDNLYDWSKVSAIRNNALVLYFYILGSCNIDLSNEATGVVVRKKTDYETLCEIIISLDYYEKSIILTMDGRDYYAEINPFALVPNYSRKPIIYEHIPVTIMEYGGAKAIDKIIISNENLPDKIVFHRGIDGAVQIWKKGKN